MYANFSAGLKQSLGYLWLSQCYRSLGPTVAGMMSKTIKAQEHLGSLGTTRMSLPEAEELWLMHYYQKLGSTRQVWVGTGSQGSRKDAPSQSHEHPPGISAHQRPSLLYRSEAWDYTVHPVAKEGCKASVSRCWSRTRGLRSLPSVASYCKWILSQSPKLSFPQEGSPAFHTGAWDWEKNDVLWCILSYCATTGKGTMIFSQFSQLWWRCFHLWTVAQIDGQSLKFCKRAIDSVLLHHLALPKH